MWKLKHGRYTDFCCKHIKEKEDTDTGTDTDSGNDNTRRQTLASGNKKLPVYFIIADDLIFASFVHMLCQMLDSTMASLLYR